MAELLKKGDILLGKYIVEGLAGRGTFGEVYHVLHPKQLSPRAIKVLRKDMPGVGSTDIQDARSRFEMEARLGDRLTHPNVIKVLEFEDEGDELYLIMEYAPGGSLKDRLKKGPLSTNEAVRLGVEVCAGLQAIHERLHAVHRDIKPSNILFDGDGTARICDLGLVQLAGDESRGSRLGSLAGSQPGTPPYMSPEQENTKGYLTPSSDLFSVGCVLFEALTGKLYKDYLGTRVRDHRADVPAWLDQIVAKALEEMPGRIPADDREQSRRYRTSLIMQGDLEQGQKGERAKQEAERQRLAELAATEERAHQKAEEEVKKERAEREKAKGEVTGKAASEKPERGKAEKTNVRTAFLGIGFLGILGIVGIVTIVVIVGSLSIIRRQLLSAQTSTQPALTQVFSPSTQSGTKTPLPTNTPILPTPELGIGSTMTGEDGLTLLYVPEGDFEMGSDSYADDEKPIHTVYLDAFWIDQTEVTNKLFSSFVIATGYQTDAEKAGWSYASIGSEWAITDGADWQHPTGPGSNVTSRDQYPVIHVSWNDAAAYCEWAGRRLPTEAEWEKAASWNELAQKKYVYPWGNDFDGSVVNFCDKNCGFDWADKNWEDGFAETSPVKNYPAGVSPYGAYDMAGNVCEWVNDWYGETYYQSSPSSNPLGPDLGAYPVLRGDSWRDNGNGVRSSNRGGNDPSFTFSFIGFRCARGTSP